MVDFFAFCKKSALAHKNRDVQKKGRPDGGDRIEHAKSHLQSNQVLQVSSAKNKI